MKAIIKKLRIKYTITSTLVAGAILLLLFGSFCALLYGAAEMTGSRTLERILLSPEAPQEDDVMGRRCFAFYYQQGDFVYIPAAYYGDEMDAYRSNINDIVTKAVQTGEGNFSVDGLYFTVFSRTLDNGFSLYAVLDRTSDRQNFATTAMLVLMVYVVALVIVALMAYLLSARTLAPVEESFKKQRDLIANASHELKTPLTVISTNLSVMKSEPASTIADNEKWIAAIDDQVTRMNGLIVNMLRLSKMENSPPKMSELNFSEITEGACLCFDVVCFEKNLELHTQIDPGITVTGERDSLERLVTCLLDNATKYAGTNGKVGLRLSADGKKAKLVVMNSGEALSPEDAKHVFDRFYRSDGARQNPDNNSFGLGLAIAQATVFAHGGTIRCHGIKDKGTVFVVTLPLARGTAKKLRTAPPAVKPAPTVGASTDATDSATSLPSLPSAAENVDNTDNTDSEKN